MSEEPLIYLVSGVALGAALFQAPSTVVVDAQPSGQTDDITPTPGERESTARAAEALTLAERRHSTATFATTIAVLALVASMLFGVLDLDDWPVIAIIAVLVPLFIAAILTAALMAQGWVRDAEHAALAGELKRRELGLSPKDPRRVKVFQLHTVNKVLSGTAKRVRSKN